MPASRGFLEILQLGSHDAFVCIPCLTDLSENEVEEDEERDEPERLTDLASGNLATAEMLRRVQSRLGRTSPEGDDDTDEDEDDPMQRLAELSYAPGQVGEALRRAQRQGAPHPGSTCVAAAALEERLRALPAFGALQEVVRVDPQIQLVLNTETMQFEDQRLRGQANPHALKERDAVEQAFWDACVSEIKAEVPTYDRTGQVRGTAR
jgi:hypothetical protein